MAVDYLGKEVIVGDIVISSYLGKLYPGVVTNCLSTGAVDVMLFGENLNGTMEQRLLFPNTQLLKVPMDMIPQSLQNRISEYRWTITQP